MTDPIEERTLPHDEQQVLQSFRLVKQLGHGKIELDVKEGQLVKLWTTDKWDLEDDRPDLREMRRP